jgi:hypothetical protein
MSGRDDIDLLTPTLSAAHEQAPAIYSLTALVLTAFFGGPFAVIALTAMNSQRLDRVGHDLPVLVFQLAATVLLLYLLVRAGQVSPVSFIELPGDRLLLIKAWALVLFGMSAALHGRFQRNMGVSPTPRPNPWPAGIACVLGGNAVTQAVIRLIQP